ncbi:ABC transporter permease [Pseudarthrobacter sp. RMG13]|uniref:ABC transporter permease n=1 Tax=Pseudarthrobacter humi TaxID=2952523 RepID=A0ABT1LV02_9MICC|nr:ABC transporter permease [Pseudarthrobacter humi]MCP9001984.1 ABC transporter permease [Pseudarthrobacter humi]
MNIEWLGRQFDNIVFLLGWHVLLAVTPLILGLLIALPLGWWAHRSRRIYPLLVGIAGLLYTVPSLALFVLLPLVLGTKILDPLNIVAALTIYTVALLVRVVADALDSVPEDTAQAAKAMGYRGYQSLLKVELPVGVPVICAGLRVAAVSNVSLVSVAALLGIPQLGSLFTQGFQLRFFTPIIAGIILCVVLAMILDGLIILLNRWLTPWTPKVAAS